MFFNPDKKDQILEQELANPNAYTDALICAEASRLSQDERVAFAESEEAQALDLSPYFGTFKQKRRLGSPCENGCIPSCKRKERSIVD